MSTPREELGRLLEEREEGARQTRTRLEAGALLGAAQLGYARLTVQEVLNLTGVGRNRFYREFKSLSDCYAAAYEREIDLVGERLLGGCGASWEEGLDEALAVLRGLVLQRPLLARALFVEVHVAGEPALAKRREVWERLSHALDRARRETSKPRHSPPPLTAAFMLGAIECAVCDYLLGGKDRGFEETLAALRALIVEAYGRSPAEQ
ncbi:MAG: TetR/AcrR family transcriptional regulator [Solirubrobacterales bacterium]